MNGLVGDSVTPFSVVPTWESLKEMGMTSRKAARYMKVSYAEAERQFANVESAKELQSNWPWRALETFGAQSWPR
jgi:hypothetical protein